tara:strand:+ start:510 stop:899 length:390 start_codon:yes stop_codon:yes gene_type:complete
MNGLSPKLPLSYDKIDSSYAMLKNYEDLVQQNLKMLILTSPGERVMEPNFGVGLRRYLFEPGVAVGIVLRRKIIDQVGIYMPFLFLEEVKITGVDEAEDLMSNYLGVTIRYNITPIDRDSVLDVVSTLQ